MHAAASTHDNGKPSPKSEKSSWDALGDVAFAFSSIGGFATAGAMVADPVGAPIGGFVGIVVITTMHALRRKEQP
jgi:hypothetical protein